MHLFARYSICHAFLLSSFCCIDIPYTPAECIQKWIMCNLVFLFRINGMEREESDSKRDGEGARATRARKAIFDLPVFVCCAERTFCIHILFCLAAIVDRATRLRNELCVHRTWSCRFWFSLSASFFSFFCFCIVFCRLHVSRYYFRRKEWAQHNKKKWYDFFPFYELQRKWFEDFPLFSIQSVEFCVCVCALSPFFFLVCLFVKSKNKRHLCTKISQPFQLQNA